MQAEEAAEVEANPAVADGAADDEDGGAILEEQAEMQTSGDNTDAEPEAKAAEDEARESWRAGGEEALMHGSVSSSEAALDGEGTLRFYFEIDPSLYPISVDSLCLYNTSESGDGAFLFEIPLDTAARNSGAPFWLSWKREMRAAQTGREAENKNVGFCAKAAGLKSAAVTLEAVLDLQEVPSDIPQQFVVSYYTGSDPFVRVKTLKLADNDYFYDPENNAVQICLTETAPSPEIHVLSVNDLTNNLTYNEAMDFSGFDGGDDGDVMGDAIEISYSSFDLGFTQSPTVCVVNIPTANEADKFRNSYISSHAESLNSGAAYNRRSGVFEADGVINDGTGYTVYWRLNFVCADKYDDIVLTGLEGSESRWQGFSRCWYGCGNLLSLDYNGFAADRAAAESDIGIIGKIIINNIDAQPSLGRIKYCRGADGPETTAEVLKGAVFDKEAKTLAAFVDLASASGEADDIVVKEITLDDYVCSGYITLCPAARIQSVSFSQFAKNGASGGADGLKRAYVRIVDLPFNPDTFRAVYTVGGGSEEKTVNIASYKDGALTFGGIITDASYITLKRIEVAAYVFNADRRIDLSGGVCREALLFGGFVRTGRC
ncbi:hypothetical protein IJT93_12365 [bacterium]|nr:hypothetical protein [bacterium]